MDILLALKTNVVSVVMAVLALLLLWKIRGKQSSFERLPPGPATNPLLGNLFQFNIKEAYKYYLEVSIPIQYYYSVILYKSEYWRLLPVQTS